MRHLCKPIASILLISLFILTITFYTPGKANSVDNGNKVFLPHIFNGNQKLIVGSRALSGIFSPFFGNLSYDLDIVEMTQVPLLTMDRQGRIISDAIDGEIRNYKGIDYLYQGAADTKVEYFETTNTTKYTAQLRVGMKFSDGVPVTADDLIFTYYTYLDPSYTGPSDLSSFDIVGLKEYQTQSITAASANGTESSVS